MKIGSENIRKFLTMADIIVKTVLIVGMYLILAVANYFIRLFRGACND